MLSLVVTTMALDPSLVINQSAEAASHVIKCENEKGKTHQWINGCKDGWYNWDLCGVGPDGTGQYVEGYKDGWEKGQQHNPARAGC